MFDNHDWRTITCEERDKLLVSGAALFVFSSLTDPHGNFGAPLIYTEWGYHGPDRAVLRDYRWPDDSRSCEHWVPDNGEELR